MGLRELSHRGAQSLRTQVERTGLGLARTVAAGTARGKPWIDAWPERFAVEPYREAADRILGGKFRLFAHREWALGFPPAWNRDPVSGTDAPLTFGKRLNYRDAALVGDIKYLWEPNRHLELVTLAQAWRLTGEARFASGCRTLVDSWIQQCPYMTGPNWTSSLELALRLVNWSCAWHLLAGDQAVLFQGEDGEAFKERWLTAVRQHCHFIAGYPSLHSSANNHLLGELLGLFVGSTTWPCWPESQHWRERARESFEQQALLQNGADGVNKEQAIWYQHEVADMMLLAGLTARANGCDFGPAFWSRLEAMFDFIASCMDVGGHVPAFGDADDAVIVRFSPDPDFHVYQSLLATGAVLFGRGAFKHKARVFDDKSRWLLGDGAAATFAALAADASASRAAAALRVGRLLHSRRRARQRARGAHGGRCGAARVSRIAAHGHADALSFTLSVAGRPVLIDPGTYAYHTERLWRDHFRGTSAHNTLSVDHLDQSVAGGPFLWSRHADTRCLAMDLDADAQCIVAEHDGYCRLNDPVRHRREIVYQHAARLIRVTDHIHCASQHSIEIFWHFAEGCRLTLGNDAARITRDGAELELRWPKTLHARLVRGSVEPIQGWISQRFDQKVPGDTLVVSGTVTGPWQGVTTITLSSQEAQ